MNSLKTALLTLTLSGFMSGSVMADEYYINLNTAAKEIPVNISTVNTPQLLNYNRTVHGFIITNADTTPVTVIFSKVTYTTTTTGTGKNITTKTTTSTPVTLSMVIVPANSTQVIPLQAGEAFLKSKTTVVDDLEVLLTTTSSTPNVDLTIDFQDSPK